MVNVFAALVFKLYMASALNKGVSRMHRCQHSWNGLVSFPDPAFMKDKGLAHFTRNLGLADYQKSGEPIKLLILADHMVRIALPKRTLESCD